MSSVWDTAHLVSSIFRQTSPQDHGTIPSTQVSSQPYRVVVFARIVPEAEVWACHSLKSWKKCSQQHQAEVMPDSVSVLRVVP